MIDRGGRGGARRGGRGPRYGVDAPFVPALFAALGTIGVVAGVLVAAARRVPRGGAHGVDLWRTVDQSGNDESVAAQDAEAAGVGDRVALHTADLPDAGLAGVHARALGPGGWFAGPWMATSVVTATRPDGRAGG